MHLQFTIYNLQFTNYFCQLKKILGDTDTYAICIYKLQFTIYKFFLPTEKKWVIHMQFVFTIYNLQTKKIIAAYTNAFSIIC